MHEVWYFTDGNEFSNQTTHLITYLTSHGTVSNTTLDLLLELTQFSPYPDTAGYYPLHLDYPVQSISVIKYRSNVISGYFVILPAHYYIAYHGRAGPDH